MRELKTQKADAQQQELWEELMLFEEPETVEEISSGGDLVIQLLKSQTVI
jgi:hypothetical protein